MTRPAYIPMRTATVEQLRELMHAMNAANRAITAAWKRGASEEEMADLRAKGAAATLAHYNACID